MSLGPHWFPFTPAYPRPEPLLVQATHLLIQRLPLLIDPAAEFRLPVVKKVLVASVDDVVLQIASGTIHDMAERSEVHLGRIEGRDRHVDAIHDVGNRCDEEAEPDGGVVKEVKSPKLLVEDVAFSFDGDVFELLEEHLVLHYVAVELW